MIMILILMIVCLMRIPSRSHALALSYTVVGSRWTRTIQRQPQEPKRQQEQRKYPLHYRHSYPLYERRHSSSSMIETPDQLWNLLETKGASKVFGSKQYISFWKHWVMHATTVLQKDLSQHLPHPVDEEELKSLSFSLGVAADIGKMPSFSNAGARAGYALEYFCRARRLASLLLGQLLVLKMEEDATTRVQAHLTDGRSLLPSSSFKSSFLRIQDESKKDHAETTVVLPTRETTLSSSSSSSSSSSPLHHGDELDKQRRSTLSMTSLGGGPGFDFVALALVSTFVASAGRPKMLPASIQATIFDYEEGWEDLVIAMDESTRRVLLQQQQPTEGHSTTMEWGGKCDITKSIDHPDNLACRERLETTDLWTCQYCVAENAQKLRSSHFIFFRDLWTRMSVGSIMILTETTPRLWPEFYDIIQEHCPYMQITFPNQRGPQLYLVKESSSSTISDGPTTTLLSHKDQVQLEEFREIAILHERRLDSGWERQVSKRMQDRETKILV